MKSVFLKQEGDTPKNRVWSFLIIYSEYDYSMKEIALHSKVGYTTLEKMWKEFREKEIIIQTRNVGKAKMYKLNLKNPIVEKFIDFYWAVVDSVVSKQNVKEVSYSPSIEGVAVSAKNL